MGFKILWISFVNFFNKSDGGEIFLFFLNYAFKTEAVFLFGNGSQLIFSKWLPVLHT